MEGGQEEMDVGDGRNVAALMEQVNLAQAAIAAADQARLESEARVVELTGQLQAAQTAQQTPVVASGSPASTGPPSESSEAGLLSWF